MTVTKVHRIEINFDKTSNDDSVDAYSVVDHYESDGYEEVENEDYDGGIKLIILQKID